MQRAEDEEARKEQANDAAAKPTLFRRALRGLVRVAKRITMRFLTQRLAKEVSFSVAAMRWLNTYAARSPQLRGGTWMQIPEPVAAKAMAERMENHRRRRENETFDEFRRRYRESAADEELEKLSQGRFFDSPHDKSRLYYMCRMRVRQLETLQDSWMYVRGMLESGAVARKQLSVWRTVLGVTPPVNPEGDQWVLTHVELLPASMPPVDGNEHVTTRTGVYVALSSTEDCEPPLRYAEQPTSSRSFEGGGGGGVGSGGGGGRSGGGGGGGGGGASASAYSSTSNVNFDSSRHGEPVAVEEVEVLSSSRGRFSTSSATSGRRRPPSSSSSASDDGVIDAEEVVVVSESPRPSSPRRR